MKKTAFLTLSLLWLFQNVAHTQGFAQLGTQFIADEGRRLITTSDGGYITAGAAGAKAILYKTDCLGNLVAQIEKNFDPGPATFWDVVELTDGSIVAVGGASVASATDTGAQVILLKTTAMLVEIATSNFKILGKEAQGKAISRTPTDHLLIYGEVTGVSVDFTDAFFQRADPVTLQPSATPVIGSNGVDLASRILPTTDGNYLLTGSSFSGNIFNPDAMIQNFLRVYKVDEFGNLIWQASVEQTFLAKYGVVESCGAVQGIQSGNFIVGGNMYNGSDELKQDMFYALINNDGVVLDTAYSFAIGQQKGTALIENSAFPGAYLMLGESDGSPFGVLSLAVGQAFEVTGQLFVGETQLDPQNLVALRDIVQLDPGRYAYMGMYPDNTTVITAKDILIFTPAAEIGIVYQNCALAATLSVPAAVFQWYFEGETIENANQGVYFPTEPGLYQVQVLDTKGCFGVSDTFRVDAPVADFTVLENNLTASFTNTSLHATSYFWDFGDGTTSQSSNPEHTYASNGMYLVRLIAKTACGFADTTVQQIGVVSEFEPAWLDRFSLAPNPTNGTFNLEMSGEPQEKMSLLLSNSIGQSLYQEELGFQSGYIRKTFDLSGQAAGIYTLQIRSGKEAKSLRIVKQ